MFNDDDEGSSAGGRPVTASLIEDEKFHCYMKFSNLGGNAEKAALKPWKVYTNRGEEAQAYSPEGEMAQISFVDKVNSIRASQLKQAVN